MKNFIFTEAYNCGKIAKVALESFFKHHDDVVNVIGLPKDFVPLSEFKDKVNFIDVSGDDRLRQLYTSGHAGTAYIFAKAVSRGYGSYDNVIHFDSDVYFIKECLSDLTSALEEGYDLIGQRRPYKHNKCGNNAVRGLHDTVGTCFFAVNTHKISTRPFPILRGMCQGINNPLGHPVLDFFDPVTFDVLRNGGKIKFLDYMDYGSANENGSWDNDHPRLNDVFDCGDKFIHFAGVGSGMAFHENGDGNVPKGYVDWTKSRYSLFSKMFYNEDIGIPYDTSIIGEVRELLYN